MGSLYCSCFYAMHYACRQSLLQICSALIILLLFAGFFRIKSAISDAMPQLKSNVISVDKIVYFSCLLLFFLQVYAAFNLYFETGWDPKAIMMYARTLMIEECIILPIFQSNLNNLLFFFFEFYVFKFEQSIRHFLRQPASPQYHSDQLFIKCAHLSFGL